MGFSRAHPLRLPLADIQRVSSKRIDLRLPG
jgi:hypothetical protein